MKTSPCLAHFQHLFTPVRIYFLIYQSNTGFCDQKGSVSRLRLDDECQCYVVTSDASANSAMWIKQRENKQTLGLGIPPCCSALSGDLRPSSGFHFKLESSHWGCLSPVLSRESSIWLTKIKNPAVSWWIMNKNKNGGLNPLTLCLITMHQTCLKGEEDDEHFL